MINLLPNLEIFLTEIRAQSEMVESISENNGVIEIKLNYESFCDRKKAFPFFIIVDSLKKKLQLVDHIKLVETGPYPDKKIQYAGHEYRINLAAIKEAKLNDNLKTFLSIIKKRMEIENISKTNAEIIITIKNEFLVHEKIWPFIHFVNLLSENLGIEPEYMRLEATKPCVTETTRYSGREYHIDLVPLHAERLRYFFHKDMTQKEACDSIFFLTSQGWSQEQFNDVGVSRATYFRYKSNLKETDKTQPDNTEIKSPVQPLSNALT
ncbi:MAG: hypothetical protein ABSA79_00090 [Candidatus Bathyarchaeia archaeon]|jgi:hypothetical protein